MGAKHLMRGIAVQEKCLEKERQEPMGEKEYQDDHGDNIKWQNYLKSPQRYDKSPKRIYEK